MSELISCDDYDREMWRGSECRREEDLTERLNSKLIEKLDQLVVVLKSWMGLFPAFSPQALRDKEEYKEFYRLVHERCDVDMSLIEEVTKAVIARDELYYKLLLVLQEDLKRNSLWKPIPESWEGAVAVYSQSNI